MAKRVLNVVWGAYPDIRVQKTNRVLKESGYETEVLCLSRKLAPEDSETIHVVSPPKDFLTRARNWFWDHTGLKATRFSWYHLKSFEKILSSRSYDIVHWNDLAGAVPAVEVAHRFGAKFILDLHENYPYNMWSTERDLKPVIARPKATKGRYDLNDWFRYEAEAVQKADKVVVTIDEMKSRLIGMYEADPDKISVFENAEPLELEKEGSLEASLLDKYREKTVMLYVGSCSLHRGLDVIIRAMALVKNKMPDLVLVIIGNGYGLSKWKTIAAELSLEDRVHFVGSLPYSEARKYYQIADWGVVPHHKYGQTDNTLPHKLYQNFVHGLPTLVSSCHALERVIKETEAGVIFTAGVPRSAAEAFLLLNQPELKERLSQNARKAAESGPHSWNHAVESLRSTYFGLVEA